MFLCTVLRAVGWSTSATRSGLRHVKRATLNSKKVVALTPDYALMDSDSSEVRAVGEAKTPFKQHPFAKWFQDALRGGEDEEDLRRLLGMYDRQCIRKVSLI